MNILFIDSAHPFLQEELSRNGFVCDLQFDLTKEQIEKILGRYDGVVIRSKLKFDSELIDKATKLKFIARVGAGMENIDVAYAEKKGIKCFHAPEGNRSAVAEHAMGMLLTLMNNICRADRQVRSGKWIREGNRGNELEGKTVGIIGYGKMGSAFAQRLKGFSVDVIAYDKYKKDFSDEYVREVSMEEIFDSADIVSLHIPLADDTLFLVNDTFINKFKKNIYLVNTSRGKCVKTDDLVKNLKNGKISGACLDVLEYETVSFEELDKSGLPEAFQYLSSSDKVIVTPHIAGWTFQSNEKMARILTEKILSFFK